LDISPAVSAALSLVDWEVLTAAGAKAAADAKRAERIVSFMVKKLI